MAKRTEGGSEWSDPPSVCERSRAHRIHSRDVPVRARKRSLAAGRSGSAAGQRLQWLAADQLAQAAHDRIEYRFDRLRIDLRFGRGELGAVELTTELELDGWILEHGSFSFGRVTDRCAGAGNCGSGYRQIYPNGVQPFVPSPAIRQTCCLRHRLATLRSNAAWLLGTAARQQPAPDRVDERWTAQLTETGAPVGIARLEQPLHRYFTGDAIVVAVELLGVRPVMIEAVRVVERD